MAIDRSDKMPAAADMPTRHVLPDLTGKEGKSGNANR